jgi:hypothetical protein
MHIHAYTYIVQGVNVCFDKDELALTYGDIASHSTSALRSPLHRQSLVRVTLSELATTNLEHTSALQTKDVQQRGLQLGLTFGHWLLGLLWLLRLLGLVGLG